MQVFQVEFELRYTKTWVGDSSSVLAEDAEKAVAKAKVAAMKPFEGEGGKIIRAKGFKLKAVNSIATVDVM